MSRVGIAQPDITLLLDLDGTIRDVTVSAAISGEGTDSWRGRRWSDTVGDIGDDKVNQMIEDARNSGVSAFRQVTQRFPSGLELPIEYTTVRLGGAAGLMAVGKNLQAVAELQTRLIAAQQTMERDYWKLREVETRYRLLFDAANEAVLLVRVADLHVVEANPAATAALGWSSESPDRATGRELLPALSAKEREPFQAMLLQVRERGKAPGMLIHLGQDRAPWMVRASLLASEPGHVFMLQLSPTGDAGLRAGNGNSAPVESLIERLPDGFVVVDRDGTVLRANRAFLDLVQTGAEGSVVGERLTRWLSRPGADMMVLLANVRKYGAVRMFATTINGEFGSETEVEISAAGDGEAETKFIGMMLRDVSRRLPSASDGTRLNAVLGSLAEQIGKTTLRKLVKDTVGEVERHYIEEALKLTDGNRTATAELLGLSRQSLYVKLNRYGLDGDSRTSPGSSA